MDDLKICGMCNEQVELTKAHNILLMHEEILEDDAFTVIEGQALGYYHKECFPFKFTGDK